METVFIVIETPYQGGDIEYDTGCSLKEWQRKTEASLVSGFSP